MDILNKLKTIGFSANITLDNIIVFIVIVAVLLAFLIWIVKTIKRILAKKVRVSDLNISIAGIGNVSLQLNKDIEKVAHSAWVEIMTRKVGLPFNEYEDVIIEIYDSWYKMFEIFRNLLKENKPIKQDSNYDKLEETLVKVLNDGLRPHLTKWQAKFRKWYDKEITKEENLDLSPQEIQRKYPEYEELVRDIKSKNEQMIQFADELKKLYKN